MLRRNLTFLLLLLTLPMPLFAANELLVEPKQSNFGDLLSSFGSKLGLGGNDEPFLTPDKAFIFSAEVKDPHTISARWDVADGYYLYREKFSFTLKESTDVTLGTAQYPPGKTKVDESFGEMEVYYHGVTLTLPVTRTSTAATPLTLIAKFQGCADAGFCYPPMKQEIMLTLPAIETLAPQPATTENPSQPFTSEQDQFSQYLSSGNLLVILAAFFGVGLALTFTPCVFPMIPILSNIIVGQGREITTRKAFILSLTYVLAMASTYTIIGVIAALSGANLQAAFQNPWILSLFSLLFVALAFSMFGFYELQLPQRLQSRLAELSNRQQGGTLIGVAIMGFLSALIVGPCVTAPLIGALIYISQSGDALLGGSALFALSMGMGTPLLIIGTSAGKLLPRAGSWMEGVKKVFGVMMLGVAIWLLERILPAAGSLLLWATLFIVSAIYMGALERLSSTASGWQKLSKGIGVVILIYGTIALFGSISGGRDILHPMAPVLLGKTSAENELHFTQIKGLKGLNQALKEANGKTVMLDFYADWCISCIEMERETFSALGVQQQLKDVILLQSDVTANDAEDQALMQQFGLFGPPSILFFDANGEELKRYRLVGFMNATDFEAHVAALLNN